MDGRTLAVGVLECTRYGKVEKEPKKDHSSAIWDGGTGAKALLEVEGIGTHA